MDPQIRENIKNFNGTFITLENLSHGGEQTYMEDRIRFQIIILFETYDLKNCNHICYFNDYPFMILFFPTYPYFYAHQFCLKLGIFKFAPFVKNEM